MARLDPALLTAALAGSLLSSCTTAPDPCALTAVFEVIADGAVLALDECTGQMALGDSEDPARWLAPAPSGVPALSWADDELVHTMIQGRYKFEGTFGDWAPMDTGQLVTFSDWQGTIGGRPALLSYGPGPAPSVHIGFEVAGAPDRVSVAFGCRDGERFYGLGARPDGTDHTGTTRLAYTAELPTPAEAVKTLRSDGEAPPAAPPPPPAVPPLAAPATFSAVVELLGEKKEGILRAHLINDVHPVHFEPGRIEYRRGPSAPADLAGRLRRFLDDNTGRQWMVEETADAGEATMGQQAEAADATARAEAEKHPLVKAVKETFPGATIAEVRTIAPTQATDSNPDPEPAEGDETP